MDLENGMGQGWLSDRTFAMYMPGFAILSLAIRKQKVENIKNYDIWFFCFIGKRTFTEYGYLGI